ncbi:enoyl-CoA hydratase [Hyphomicrobium sp.]|uniref:enoyl-CoA hydratase n=1 Tax=Hyphomicrobium sp. TaxID=82 RepID=UPI002D78C9BD|nr:enoyl-CoA hydratase [Hyphomicrobium sp.]HET6390549.1 enoyl-CoA hydratase [Hyphomicrobium sp.]
MQDLSPLTQQSLLSEPVEAGVVRLTLNRPEARNALSRDLLKQLHEEIERLGQEKNVGAIVLGAAGNVFSSGHDLKELTAHRADADGGEAFFRETMTACSAMMRAIVACPKPVIAAVEGRATAAGCQLVATCDLAVAADTADFATPGVNIGLFCSTPMVALSRNVARKQAMEMLLLGEPISAADALAYGLVNRVVSRGDVMAEALGMARTIAAKSKSTVAIGKQAFYRQAEMPLEEAYAYASEVMVKNMMAADANEGICAFIEKRKPEWKDK